MHLTTAGGPTARVRPFLKWAGGKRQLLRELRRFVPREFGAYHEPFLGSGAVFFDLWRRGMLDRRSCRLTDINPDLVGCYRALARSVDRVVSELHALARAHARQPSEAYYRVRDDLFSRYRILIPPDRRRRPAGSVTEVSLVTNGRAVRMPSAVGS